MRILVADDSALVRRLLRQALQQADERVLIDEFGDGDAVLRALVKTDYDMVFSDVYMPGKGGLDAIVEAKERGRTAFCVFMSNDMSRELVGVAQKIGAFEFLQKPFRPEEVKAVVDCYRRMREPTDVLVVDDSETVRKIIARVLERSRFALRTASAPDGPSAVALCRTKPFGIVFLDVNMPGMDGYEALVAIRESQPSAKIVLISGEDKEAIMIRAGDLAVDGFLPKPFLPRDVDLALYRLFGLTAPQLAVQRAATGG